MCFFFCNSSFGDPCEPKRAKSKDFAECWNWLFSKSIYLIFSIRVSVDGVLFEEKILDEKLFFFALEFWQSKMPKMFLKHYGSQVLDFKII